MTAPVMIMAGGTGGHIFPGLAVAAELQRRGHEVHWLGSSAGLEGRLVPEAGLPLHRLAVRGLRGKRGLAKLTGPVRLMISVLQALWILARLRPSVCVGFGGYPAAPGGLAARLLGCPLVIHEQNAIAGMTNRHLSRWATRVLTAFPNVLEGGACVGNPVRPEIDQIGMNRLADGRQPSDRIRILVVGGSQGARALNQEVPQVLAQVSQVGPLSITHQTGEAGLNQVTEAYASLSLEANVVPFIQRMDQAYRDADVVICRAGALTVSELAAAAMPALLIPFPYAVDDHQTANGQQLVDAGAALLLKETDVSRWAEVITDLVRAPEKLTQMARAARSVAKPQATTMATDVIEEVARG